DFIGKDLHDCGARSRRSLNWSTNGRHIRPLLHRDLHQSSVPPSDDRHLLSASAGVNEQWWQRNTFLNTRAHPAARCGKGQQHSGKQRPTNLRVTWATVLFHDIVAGLVYAYVPITPPLVHRPIYCGPAKDTIHDISL
ncbi:unnamed protein product, partial [Ectocarpus sp. 8 AP-2014]